MQPKQTIQVIKTDSNIFNSYLPFAQANVRWTQSARVWRGFLYSPLKKHEEVNRMGKTSELIQGLYAEPKCVIMLVLVIQGNLL